ncbi:MAG: helicase SNF2, partial [Sphingobacteriales bacterium]
HIPAAEEDVEVIRLFRAGFIKFPVKDRLAVLSSVIPDLQSRYPVSLPDSMRFETLEADPVPQLLLREYENKYLMLVPQYRYDDLVVNYEAEPKNTLRTLVTGGLQVVKRNEAKERTFIEMLKQLHPSLSKQFHNDVLFLTFHEAMMNNWFIETVRQLQEHNIPVLGILELEKFRFNTNRPKWNMKAGSGIDWFDLEVEVSFGDQIVPLREIKKAVANKQKVVVLGDGTLGMLPDDWINKYAMLLKLGDLQQDNNLRVNKLHFTLIDELHEQIDNEKLLSEISEKKRKLSNIENISTVKQSKAVKATLRPYQTSGFQWMQALDELGWGGCLGDDMGLGKTLQTITFLQFLKEKYKGSTHLVVCPTSLIYNWEIELKKFAPALRYHIYYGLEREFTGDHFEDYDLVISSYGTVRNDIEQLLQFQWHYVILDESQTIKNPEAQTTKAMQLLQAKNRLALSGTPVQN